MMAPGRIVVTHLVHSAIADAQVDAALQGVPPGSVHRVVIKPIQIPLAEALEIDWAAAREAQERVVREKLGPLQRDYPDYALAYFGTAPIALAIHLGQLAESWSAVEVFQQHHLTKEWTWRRSPGVLSADAAVTVENLPRDVVHANDDVVVRLSISHTVAPSVTLAVVDTPMSEVDIRVARPSPDVLESAGDVERVARAFAEVLDAITATRPNARFVHVFAAVPPALAFRLGNLLSPTKHPPIQLYQFARGDAAQYQPVLRLNWQGPHELPLSEVQVARAALLRIAAAEELTRVAQWAANLRPAGESEPPRPWWRRCIAGNADLEALGKSVPSEWNSLASVFHTPIVTSAVSTEASPSGEAFSYDDSTRRWILSDRLLAKIGTRLTDDTRCRRALRMLLFHESLHRRSHALTGATAERVGRFPKVVEELDYQADVWAMLHEFAYTSTVSEHKAPPVGCLFGELVDIALHTFWAFDDEGRDLDEIPVRRLNRYLIWYWQALRLQGTSDLSAAVHVLATKPVLEISGPTIRIRGERLVYDLRTHRSVDLEMALIRRDQRLLRVGNAPGVKIADVLAGFRSRDGSRIANALRSIFDAHHDDET